MDEATELAENRFAEEATKNGSEIKEVLSGMIMSDYSTYFTIAIEGIQDSSSKWGNVLSKFLYEALTDPAKKLTPVVQDEKKAVLVHLIKEMMAGEYGASVSMNDDVGNLSAILSLGEKELDEYLKTIAPDLTRLGEARDVFRYGNELKIGGYALEVVGLISAGVDIAGATAAEKQQMIELIAQYDKNMRYLDNLCGATDGALYEACDAVRREMRMAIEGVFQAADNTRKIGFGKLLAEQLMEKGISLAGGSVASALLLGGKIGGAITSGTGRYIEASDELLYLGQIKNDVKEAMENAVVTKDQALFDLTELYFAVQRNGMDATQTFYERYSETAVGIWHTFWKNFDPEETVNNIDKQRKALAKNQAMLREDMERLLTEELTQTAPIETVAPASTKYAVAKGSSRIRSAPNTDNRNITGYAKKGDRYEILELVPDNRGYSDWYKVLLDDGSIGYISAGVTDEVEVKQPNTQSSKVAKSVSLGNQYAVAKGSANIRSSPGITGSSIKDHAYEGDSYQILGVVPDQNGGSDWYKIQLSDGSVGYISSGITDAVEIDKPKTAPSKDAKSTASGKKYAVAKGSANIRSSPDSSDNSNITDKAYKGDSYQILDVVPNPNGGSDWYKIQLSDGSVGYISSGITDAVEKK